MKNLPFYLLITSALAVSGCVQPHSSGGHAEPDMAGDTATAEKSVNVEVVKEDSGDAEVEAAWGAVERWAEAWANGDVDGYIGSYTPDYAPSGGGSHEAWVRQRTDRLTKPSKIELRLSNRKVDLTASDRATVSFDQAYQSDTYSDKVRKTLHLHRIGEDWRIAKESSG